MKVACMHLDAQDVRRVLPTLQATTTRSSCSSKRGPPSREINPGYILPFGTVRRPTPWSPWTTATMTRPNSFVPWCIHRTYLRYIHRNTFGRGRLRIGPNPWTALFGACLACCRSPVRRIPCFLRGNARLDCCSMWECTPVSTTPLVHSWVPLKGTLRQISCSLELAIA